MTPETKTVCEGQFTTVAIDVPQALREEAQRIASEENWTLSKAIVFLAACGVDAQRAAEQKVKLSYERLMNEQADPAQKHVARNDLFRATFGSDAIATDQVR